MSKHLPDCMMPDGGDPCLGYQELYDENYELTAQIGALREALEFVRDIPMQWKTKKPFEIYQDQAVAANKALSTPPPAALEALRREIVEECKDIAQQYADRATAAGERRMALSIVGKLQRFADKA